MKNPLKKLFTKRKAKKVESMMREDGSLPKHVELTTDIQQNEEIFKKVFENCSDVVFRTTRILGRTKALIIYVDNLIDNKHFEEVVLKPLMFQAISEEVHNSAAITKILEEQIVAVGQTTNAASIDEVVRSVLTGNVAILTEGTKEALIASIEGGERRSVSEPSTETVIRGPREAFTEKIKNNISLVRKRLRTPNLKMESLRVGDVSQTKIVIAYIKGTAPEGVVQEVRNRLNRIKINGVLESGYIEEFIEDEVYTPFPLVQNTERPDVVAANLLEGRVAIFTDNTPFVLIVPTVFWSGLQASEDYYEHYITGTFFRWIRLVFMFFALLLPSLYVAVTTFHTEMIPTNLLMSIVDAREASPFPAIVEALIMEITFEALREAGIRLPRAVGQALSIVGALVIGQAAVQAGIISAPMVIIVSLTGISSFTIPRFDMAFAIRILRFPMIVLAGTLGLYGITLGVLGLLIHLVGLRSFGVPYLAPFAPLRLQSLEDIFVRTPWWDMHTQPDLIVNDQKVRVPIGQMPSPKQKNESPSNKSDQS